MRTIKFWFLAVTLAASALPLCAQSCNQSAPITITTSGNVTIAPAASGSGNVHLCSVTFALSTASNVTFISISGTGSTVNLSGTYPNVATFTWNFGGQLAGGMGNSIGLTIATATTGGGLATFYQTQ